ncbi:MAG TPA: UDP-N-acetylmuramoyl-L-alanine--D-glutamate ligase [Candidatus Saccharimonadales bacterium]|nr:UDP-N-acetylmuramoyl-L-alanine--D-glutamate ligase [Candidatus Saccharimonadales bacterium]
MRVAILGYADQGRAALDYWREGNEITICDSRTDVELPEGVHHQLGENYLQNLDQFDLIVRGAPSIHPRYIIEANSLEIMNKVTTVTNEFFRVCPSKNIIGVTGTKGKGTTSTLITKMLEASGQRVHLGGNIGTPPLDILKADIQSDDWVVLELANFQLIDFKYSPPIAVCLMVVPEHLDWHPDINEYLVSKQQLFAHQTADDIAIYYSKNRNSRQVVSVSPGVKVPYMKAPGAFVDDGMITIDGQPICHTRELKLLGRHNWQNVCAALTATWIISKDVEAIRSVLTTFSGLEYRLQFIRAVDGVSYYNDSFGTTPETAIVAIKAFEQPKVLILGGSDKGASFEKLAQAVHENNVRQVLTIGKMGPEIGQALLHVGFEDISDGGQTMDEIVSNAARLAEPGDVVLLSTACASFDMFKNYKDRGQQFNQAVQVLA